jgi:hypothetical protein
MTLHPTNDKFRKCLCCGYCKLIKEQPMSISMQELNPHNYPTTPEIDANLAILLDRMNQVRDAYAIPMIVTSGLRSQADQQRINPKAPKSHHLMGEAVDIADADRKLTNWVKVNMDLMEQIGLWFEDFDHTISWVHFQCVPPKSGNRVFIP